MNNHEKGNMVQRKNPLINKYPVYLLKVAQELRMGGDVGGVLESTFRG